MRAVNDFSTSDWYTVAIVAAGVILLILAVVVIERSFPEHWG
jgi:hypothetical protein